MPKQANPGRLTAAQFNARASTLRSTAPVLAAAKRVLVEGATVPAASTERGVTVQAVYRVLRLLKGAGSVSFTVTCPTHRAEQLKGLVKWQLAKWKADELAQSQPPVPAVEVSEPATEQPATT